MGRYYQTDKPVFVQDTIMRPDYSLLERSLGTVQKDYDTQQAIADKIMNIDFNHLNSEEENENAAVAKDYYLQNANEIASLMMNDKNNYRKYMGRLKDLSRDLQKDFSEGPIGLMQASYNQEKAWREANKKTLETNPALYNALYREAQKNWGGNSITKGVWQQENALKQFDQQKIEDNIQKLVADIKKSSVQTTDGRYKTTIDNEIKYLSEDDILNYATNKVLSDPEALAYFRQAQRVGIGNYFNQDGSLNTTGGQLGSWLQGLRSYAYKQVEQAQKKEEDKYGLQKDKYAWEMALEDKKQANRKALKDYENNLKESTKIMAKNTVSLGYNGTPKELESEISEVLNRERARQEYINKGLEVPENLKETPNEKKIRTTYYKETIDSMINNEELNKNPKFIEFLKNNNFDVNKLRDNFGKEFSLTSEEREKNREDRMKFKNLVDNFYKQQEKQLRYITTPVRYLDKMSKNGEGLPTVRINGKTYDVKYENVGDGTKVPYSIINGQKLYIDNPHNGLFRTNIIEQAKKANNNTYNSFYTKAKDNMVKNMTNPNLNQTVFTTSIDFNNKDYDELKVALDNALNYMQDYKLGKVTVDKYGNKVLSEGKLGETETSWFRDRDFSSLLEHIDNMRKSGLDVKGFTDPRYFSVEYIDGSGGKQFVVKAKHGEDVVGGIDMGQNEFIIDVPINTNIDSVIRKRSKAFYDSLPPSERREALLQSTSRNNNAATVGQMFAEKMTSRHGTDYTQNLNYIGDGSIKMDVSFNTKPNGLKYGRARFYKMVGNTKKYLPDKFGSGIDLLNPQDAVSLTKDLYDIYSGVEGAVDEELLNKYLNQ